MSSHVRLMTLDVSRRQSRVDAEFLTHPQLLVVLVKCARECGESHSQFLNVPRSRRVPIKGGAHRPGDAIVCGGLLGNLHEMQPVPRVGFDLEAYPRHRRHAHLIGGGVTR